MSNLSENVNIEIPENDYRPERNPFSLKTVAIFTTTLVLLIAAVIYYFNQPGMPLAISPETTYITGPLMVDGKTVDYTRAIELRAYPTEMQTDDNGMRVFISAVGTGPFLPPNYPNRLDRMGLMYDKLGIERPFAPSGRFVPLDAVFVNHELRTGCDKYKLERILSKPWTFDDVPEMEAWLEEMNPTLDILVESLNHKTFFIPLLEEHSNIFSEDVMERYSSLREMARMLVYRANYRIANGDIDGAIDDRIAVTRFGRHLSRHPFLIDLLVGLAIEGIGNTIPICEPPHVLPSAAQIERLREGIRNLPEMPAFGHFLEYERLLSLGIIQKFAINGYEFRDLFPHAESIPKIGRVDLNLLMRRFNEQYEIFMNDHNYQGPEFPSFDLRVLSTNERSERAADIFILSFVPAMAPAQEAIWRLNCVENLNEIALAMLTYNEEHGTLPPTFTVDDEGKALHSWRVLLLPQIGYKDLYDKIKLEEPWDSEYNRQFHTEAIPVYRCRSNTLLSPGLSSYLVAVGEDLPFNNSGQGRKLSDFGRHSGEMILVSETKAAACWMSPNADIPHEDAIKSVSQGDSTASVTAFGSVHSGCFCIGTRNGVGRVESLTSRTEAFDAMLKGIEYVKE